MKDLKNALILVTGGASGIGRLVSLDFAHLGARVIAWDQDGASLKRLEMEAEAQGVFIRGMTCDVSDRDAVYRKAQRIEAEYGPLDILMNNAGVVSGKPFLETSDEQIIRSINVNTLAHFWTLRAFLPGMIRHGAGHIVTIASTAGIIGIRGLADYSASKSGAIGFHESLRMELRHMKSRIKSTLVCPCFVDTGMFQGVKTKFPLLLPILKPEKVACDIVKAVRTNRRQIILPSFMGVFFFLRFLPVPVIDAMADFLGVNHAMDEFIGRPSRWRPSGMEYQRDLLRKAE